MTRSIPLQTRQLLRAAHRGDAQGCRWLIDHGADVNARGHNGFTPLHLAVGRRHREVVELLLGAGALVDAVGSFNWTPFRIARERVRGPSFSGLASDEEMLELLKVARVEQDAKRKPPTQQ